MDNTVLVIGGGNHHNALGVVRALGRRGYQVELITFGSLRKNYIASSKYVCKHHALADVKELASYLLYREPKKDKEIVISCADAVTEHLNLHYNRLSEIYILPGVKQQGKMVDLMDKTTMIEMAARRGINAPHIWTLPTDKEKVTFPCITKSYLSSHGGKADIVICSNREQLDNFLVDNTDNVFVQPYIDKKEEVQFIGCSLNGGEDIIIPGMTKVLRSQPNTNTGFLEYGPIDPFYEDIVEHSKSYIRDCGYSGLFSIEFIRGKDDKVYFLETNFRNDGNAYCVTESGVNLPVVWVKACLNEDYRSELHKPKHIVVMPEFQDFKLVLQRRLSFGRWLKDLHLTDVFLEYTKDDKRPFFQFIIDKLKH